MSNGYSNTDIFSVKSTADLAMDDIFLDDRGMAHINLGHRSIQNITQMGIREAVEKPTHVYLSAIDPKRYLFRSSNVQSKSGKSMVVVVEREAVRGRVVTATPHQNPKGQVVWESSGSLYSSYDDREDLLYISKGSSRDAYAMESPEDDHIWYRCAEDDDTPVGVTIFDLRAYWKQNKSDLLKRVATFLNVLPGEIELRVDAALRMGTRL